MKKYFYSLEEVANFVGLTRQTLCNWIGCNKSYKVKNADNKINGVGGAFVAYHLFDKGRLKVMKECVFILENRFKKSSNKSKKIPDELLLLREEIEDVEKIFNSVKETSERNKKNKTEESNDE